jgi:hypothetical protein
MRVCVYVCVWNSTFFITCMHSCVCGVDRDQAPRAAIDSPVAAYKDLQDPKDAKDSTAQLLEAPR